MFAEALAAHRVLERLHDIHEVHVDTDACDSEDGAGSLTFRQPIGVCARRTTLVAARSPPPRSPPSLSAGQLRKGKESLCDSGLLIEVNGNDNI